MTLHRPSPDAPYALLREMAEAPALLRGFDPERLAGWRQALRHQHKLFITGEGSSRIFPARNMIDRARRMRGAPVIETEGARLAACYDLSGHAVIGLSNSGRTRELVSLFEKLAGEGLKTHAITAAANSPITAAAHDSIVLDCGAEQAVAASKSVIEQALLLQALLGGDEWAGATRAADAAETIFAAPADQRLAEKLAAAPTIYICGANTGAAEELALKSCEITRQKSVYLDGTLVLHGIEEVMTVGDCVVLVEPFAAEMERYQNVLSGIGVSVVAIAQDETPFPTLRLPQAAGFDNYLQLMAGWCLLTAAGQLRGVDLDRTLRARKVGNAVG